MKPIKADEIRGKTFASPEEMLEYEKNEYMPLHEFKRIQKEWEYERQMLIDEYAELIERDYVKKSEVDKKVEK